MFQVEMEKQFGKFEGFEYKPKAKYNRKVPKLVKDVGINDAPFVVRPKLGSGGTMMHPLYRVWDSMLDRCYSDKLKSRLPTYIDVTCCEEWLLFSNFANWAKDKYVEGYHLDKDILVRNNKIYSPATCVFLAPAVNTIITLSSASRGKYDLPIGVCKRSDTKKYLGYINKEGVRYHLGYFDTPELAHKEWQKHKLQDLIGFNNILLKRIIDQLKFEIENDLETLSF